MGTVTDQMNDLATASEDAGLKLSDFVPGATFVAALDNTLKQLTKIETAMDGIANRPNPFIDEQTAALQKRLGIGPTPLLDDPGGINIPSPKPPIELPVTQMTEFSTELHAVVDASNHLNAEWTAYENTVNRISAVQDIRLDNVEHENEIVDQLRARWAEVNKSVESTTAAGKRTTAEIFAMNIAANSLSQIFTTMIFKAQSLADVMNSIVQGIFTQVIQLGIRSVIGGITGGPAGAVNAAAGGGNPLDFTPDPGNFTKPTGDTYNFTFNGQENAGDLEDMVKRVVPGIMADEQRKRR
jgi:hypothetical protein